MILQRLIATSIVHLISMASSFGVAAIVVQPLLAKIHLPTAPSLSTDASFFLDAITDTPKGTLLLFTSALYLLGVLCLIRPALSAFWIRALHRRGALTLKQLLRACGVDLAFGFAALCVCVVGIFAGSLAEFIGSFPDPRPVFILQVLCIGMTIVVLASLSAMRDLSLAQVSLGNTSLFPSITSGCRLLANPKRWTTYILLSVLAVAASIGATLTPTLQSKLFGLGATHLLLFLATVLRATWLITMLRFSDTHHLGQH